MAVHDCGILMAGAYSTKRSARRLWRGHFMKSFGLALTMALALGIGVSAHAQVYRGYPSYGGGYERGSRGGSPAYQIGVEDGRSDGERDMYRRHSFRPEQNSN